MKAAWIPTDTELDTLARSSAPPALTSDRAEQMRTRLLAARPSVGQRPRQGVWPWLAGISIALSAAAALIIWLAMRPGSGTEPTEQKVSIASLTPSTFERTSDWPDYVVNLSDGKISVHVAELAAGERFRIRIRDSEIEVRATQFMVESSHGTLTSIVVDRGSIELRQPGQPPIRLDSGMHWARAQTAALPAAPTPVSIIAAAAPANPSAPAPRVTRPKRSNAPRSEPSPAAITTQVTAAPTPPLSAKPGELDFRAGWSALRAGRSIEAMKSFSAACGAAQQEAFGEDACFWSGVAARRAGQARIARDSLARFLARFPTSARAAEASALLGWELYDAGELDAAERLFRSAVTDRVPKVRDSAQRGLTAIERRRTSR